MKRHLFLGSACAARLVYTFDRGRYLGGSNAYPAQARLVAGYESKQ